MLRLLSIATLLMIVLCVIVSASIALADETAPVPAAQPAAGTPDLEAVEPDRRMLDQSLAAAGAVGGEDIYEFDFVIEVETIPNPEFPEPSNTQDI